MAGFNFSYYDLRRLQRGLWHGPSYSVEERDYLDFAVQWLGLRDVLLREPGNSEMFTEILHSYFVEAWRFGGWAAPHEPPGVSWGRSGDSYWQSLRHRQRADGYWESLEQRQEVFEFANYMIEEPLVVLQQSPPTAQAVAALAMRGAGVAIGTYVGFEAGAQEALLLTVPTGVVLGGAAVGLARGLEDVLEEKIKEIINRL